MAKRVQVTMELDRIRGVWRAWWTDSQGYLVRRAYYGFNKREARREAVREAKGK